jgi:muramidase (phage lysozyme)
MVLEPKLELDRINPIEQTSVNEFPRSLSLERDNALQYRAVASPELRAQIEFLPPGYNPNPPREQQHNAYPSQDYSQPRTSVIAGIEYTPFNQPGRSYEFRGITTARERSFRAGTQRFSQNRPVAYAPEEAREQIPVGSVVEVTTEEGKTAKALIIGHHQQGYSQTDRAWFILSEQLGGKLGYRRDHSGGNVTVEVVGEATEFQRKMALINSLPASRRRDAGEALPAQVEELVDRQVETALNSNERTFNSPAYPQQFDQSAPSTKAQQILGFNFGMSVDDVVRDFNVNPEEARKILAFLATIREYETPASGYAGYVMNFGDTSAGAATTLAANGGRYPPHPQNCVPIPNTDLCSDAYGAYQFLSTTISPIVGGLGVPLTPQAQDWAAIKLMEQCGAFDALIQGDTTRAIDLAANIWASFPTLSSNTGAHGQTYRTMGEVQSKFEEALAET